MSENEGPEREGGGPPPLRAFMERSPGRLLVEAALGGAGGALLSIGLGLAELRGAFMVAGAIAAPLALMLTPVRGSIIYRAVRYGLALFVLLTLTVSMSGPGRGRPIEELILFGLLFFAIGTLGHGAMAATVDRRSGGDAE
jgi:hypothetical protein